MIILHKQWIISIRMKNCKHHIQSITGHHFGMGKTEIFTIVKFRLFCEVFEHVIKITENVSENTISAPQRCLELSKVARECESMLESLRKNITNTMPYIYKERRNNHRP